MDTLSIIYSYVDSFIIGYISSDPLSIGFKNIGECKWFAHFLLHESSDPGIKTTSSGSHAATGEFSHLGSPIVYGYYFKFALA